MGGQAQRVVVVEVTPHAEFAEPTRVFTGPALPRVGTGALMRMRGQIYPVRPPAKPLTGLKKIGNALVASASIIDFQNTRIDGVLHPDLPVGRPGHPAPPHHRDGHDGAHGDAPGPVTVRAAGSVALGAGAVPPEVLRTEAPKDSLGRYRGWEDSPTDWPSRYLINERARRRAAARSAYRRPRALHPRADDIRVLPLQPGRGALHRRGRHAVLAGCLPRPRAAGGVGYGWWDQEVKGGLVAT